MVFSHRIPLSENHYLVGQSKCMGIEEHEHQLLEEISLRCPDRLFVYPHLSLSNNRIICSKSCSRANKCNNSCVKFIKNDVLQYGILQKLILLDPDQQCYGMIQQLRPAPSSLCCDSITNAEINDHIISFYPPRLENKHVCDEYRLCHMHYYFIQ